MRCILLIVLTAALAAQTPRVQISNTTESLRGVSVVSREVAWASGTHGTYLRTIDAGRTWTPAQVPDAATLDFRAVAAFSSDEAFLMSIGPGEQSRIYHTADAGKHWDLQFTNKNPKGFFDSMVFWDRAHGVAIGDPVPDESGTLKFELLLTDDGQTWHEVPLTQLPPALEGEGAFAASNTCIAVLPSMWEERPSPVRGQMWGQPPSAVQPGEARQGATLLSIGMNGKGTTSSRAEKLNDSSGASAPESATSPDPNIWFATGGKTARVFHSPDRGQTWQVFDTPIGKGPDSVGIFSIAFRDRLHGVIAGGDYKHPNHDGANLAFTDDGGRTWTLSTIHPQAFFSAVAYDRKVNDQAIQEQWTEAQKEKEGKKTRIKPATPQRIFLVGQDFIFDFRPPADPHRISANKKLAMKFNAAGAYPDGGALIVGPKGAIATIP
jgi:photosystem II stability/assembly factor-like uncharacterized protein